MSTTEAPAVDSVWTEASDASDPAPVPAATVRPAVLLPDGRVVEWPNSMGASPSRTGWPARFDAAARLATTVHPGPVGELVERELLAALICAGRFGAEPHLEQDALLIRLVEHVLATVERRIAVVRVAQHARPHRAFASRRPPEWPQPIGSDDVPLE